MLRLLRRSHNFTVPSRELLRKELGDCWVSPVTQRECSVCSEPIKEWVSMSQMCSPPLLDPATSSFGDGDRSRCIGDLMDLKVDRMAGFASSMRQIYGNRYFDQ